MSNKCNWRLEAISNAAVNRKKTSFILMAGQNDVGKRKDSHIKIPSALCSREHCSIFLEGDKVTVKDTSRNGTYITFSGDIGTKHYTNMTTEQPLGENDLISFGFNTAAVYDVNDKHAFIYRLVKDPIEVIDIVDSDDETQLQSTPVHRDKIIEIDSPNKIIEIPSDSDSEYSGDEHFQNIDEIDEEEEEENDEEEDVEEEDEEYDIEEDEQSDSLSSLGSEDDSFVVTKTIVKCATPTETISLEEDEEENESTPAHIDAKKPSQTEQSNAESNGTANEPSTSTNPEKTESAETSKGTEKKNDDEEYRLANIKRRIAQKVTKKSTIIKPQPLKKRRRQTITEAEYNEQKKELSTEQYKLRRERLANLGNKEKAKRTAAAENAPEPARIPFVPKVKNCIVTRGEQLCTDMLALNSTNT